MIYIESGAFKGTLKCAIPPDIMAGFIGASPRVPRAVLIFDFLFAFFAITHLSLSHEQHT
jgi:hypothetical protein